MEKKEIGYTLRGIPDDLWKQFRIKLILEGTNIKASILDHVREVAAGRRRAITRKENDPD